MRLLEGFYVESNGVIFSVKGVLHPSGRVVAGPAYIPIQGRLKRVRSLGEGLSFLHKFMPDLLGWQEYAGQILPLIPFSEISRIYDPLDFTPENRREEVLDAIHLKRILEDLSGVRVGISGSILLGLSSSESDIDLVVYGLSAGERFYQTLRELRKESILKPVREYSWIRESRADSSISPRVWLKLEEKKLLTGLYKDRLYTAKIVPLPEEYWESLNQRVRELGRGEAVFEVIDDEFSKTTPNLYQVGVIKVLDGRGEIRDVSQVVSMRSRFAELAGKWGA